MTVTLPVHPLEGVALPAALFTRSQGGRRYVDVEHPLSRYMRLPLEWTDRAPLVPPSVGGREVSLSIPALLNLAQAVQVALAQSATRQPCPVLRPSLTRPAFRALGQLIIKPPANSSPGAAHPGAVLE